MKINVTIDTEKPILEQIKRFLPKPKYIIKKEDVGRSGLYPVTVNGVREYCFRPLGHVLDIDVGKMCLKVRDHWYVENDEQYQRRMNKRK